MARLLERVPVIEILVRIFKSSQCLLYVIGVFLERIGVPFTSMCLEKIPTVNVDRPGNLIQWICDGVNNRCTQRSRILCIQFTGPVLLQAMFATAVENVLLPTALYTDDSPYTMIMGSEFHSRTPA